MPNTRLDELSAPPPMTAGEQVPTAGGPTDHGSPVWSAIATIPEFLWELSLGIYLIVKGFRPSPILDGPPEPRPRHHDGELGIPAQGHAAADLDPSTHPAPSTQPAERP